MAGPTSFRAFILALSLSGAAAEAAEPVSSPHSAPGAPPVLYVHAGAVGAFPQVNAQATGGGIFSAANIAIPPQYTLALETGYFLTPNLAIGFGAGVPPIAHIKAAGFPMAAALGTALQGSVRYGPVVMLLQYHFTQFGAFQPYAGVGAGYVLNLGNINDGVLTNFSWDQNFAFVLQAGTDWMFTPSWGVFIDGKKLFYSTDAQGFSGGIPVRTHARLDPWAASTGITFKY